MRDVENFVSTPTLISGISGKGIVGIAANRSTSLAWSNDGCIYSWGHNITGN